MRTDLLERYVILLARHDAAGIAFDSVDQDCIERDCATERVAGTTRFPGVFGFLPAELRTTLAATLAAMPYQTGPHSTGVVPLAIFVSIDDSAIDRPAADVTAIAADALASAFNIDPNAFQTVVLPNREYPQRPLFTLPLRIGATSPETFALLDEVRQREWISNDPIVSKFGLQFEPVSVFDPPPGELPDVLLLDHWNELQALFIIEPERRPRLVIACGFEPALDDHALAESSCLVIRDPIDAISPTFIKKIVYALIHDQPLPEMLKSAFRESPPTDAYLIADPASVQQLRMFHAMQELENEIATLESQLPSHLRKRHDTLIPIQPGSLLRLDFGQESDALVPMSRVRESLLQFRAWLADFRATEHFVPGAPRRVDITLLRTDPRSGRPLYVEANDVLAAGNRYRVNVRIGLRSSASLMRGEVPSIDPLLPPPEEGSRGHLLHIVLYPLDFKAIGPTIRRIILPLEGPSKAASFTVVAPETKGPARLRVAVYYDADLATQSIDESGAYRNHLIQSFLFQTTIADYEQWSQDSPTSASLEFSRTANFAQLEQYTTRVASFAVNESPNGTHQVMMKRAGTHASFSINPLLMQKAIGEVRAELFNATAIDPDAKFPRFPEGAIEDEVAFDNAIRALATKGRDLRQRIFADDSEAVTAVMRGVSKAIDDVVQVVRFDKDFYFPWSVLYDFPLPKEVFGAPPAEVCKGFQRTNADGSRFTSRQCLEQCLHPNRDAYCVYGFWGTRVQVEQTLHRPATSENAIRELDIRDHGVLVVTALDTPTAAQFGSDLKAKLGQQWVEELTAPPDLLTKLWSADRPAIVMVLGHYQTRPVTGELNLPRIRIPGGWLIADDILTKVENDDAWNGHHPLVILAACDSAGEDLLTMNGFVTAFAKARAGAVLGTETTVFESLARRFSRSVAEALLKNQSLGVAVLDFRRELLHELNPLGFVFSAYGDADLARLKTGNA
ncbi:MAG TPA: CHAT domain-containing protein [Thermoanaerobaculia bacterium]|nr:CHAT domain-containing protein [Thermoanaerobaculia bacterium]